MRPIENFEYPPDLQKDFEKAKKLEWITVFYLLSAIVVMYLTMGNSQAMKTAWFEDLLSLTPSVSFLISARIFSRKPNEEFPYGYHRVVSIAYLCSSLALFAVGGFLLLDSGMTIVEQDRPTIGMITLFGHSFWLGYLMIGALIYGSVPAVFLGRMKLPLAERLHEKNLYTDAEMNKADWMTGLAAIVGIIGIGFGLWWADSAAAALISLDILHDGYKNLKQAVVDLMNQEPKTVNNQETDPLIKLVREHLSRKTWIRDVQVRLREEGHIYMGEAFVVPAEDLNLTQHIEEAAQEIKNINWRLHEVVITPVKELPEPD
ncbi:cobalt transporter [Adhaeribacter aerolatus]|uniref:Cobalt transporter n=1 Tax=Adhaeribacter aerolatus TaxID=670289 RepID=A0A512AVK8_9BACT|nr:cation diffusion facilitator family transporter [Adhaeribacter aerolatus]GEO03749.1 cobalt transporter [Adhaeribacter aerolatus]